MSPRFAIPWIISASTALSLLLSPGTAAADESGLRYSLGLLAGSTRMDGSLATYQWDTRPRLAWGTIALAGHGRLAGGIRFWTSRTTQRIDPSTTATSSTIRSTQVELLGRGRIARVAGIDLHAIASVGRLHLGYHPDHVALDVGLGSPAVVTLAPIDEWTGGAGLGFERPVGADWNAGFSIDRGIFRLDTAHRKGNQIEYRRESFGEWNGRIEVTRSFHR